MHKKVILMPITAEHFPEQDLTVLTLTGATKQGETFEALQRFYDNNPTNLLMWVLKSESGYHHTFGDTQHIITYVKSKIHLRPHAKTAMVALTPLEFGISRMSQGVIQSKEISVDLRVFSDIEKACAWLGITYSLPETDTLADK